MDCFLHIIFHSCLARPRQPDTGCIRPPSSFELQDLQDATLAFLISTLLFLIKSSWFLSFSVKRRLRTCGHELHGNCLNAASLARFLNRATLEQLGPSSSGLVAGFGNAQHGCQRFFLQYLSNSVSIGWREVHSYICKGHVA